jgi:hypothetical protein
MLELLSEAGRSFLRAFVGSLLVLLPGVLAAPDLAGLKGVGVAALISSVAAGLKALQVFVPRLSFAEVVGEKYGVFVDSAARAFLGTLLVLLPGVLDAPDLGTSKALLTAAIVAAVTAAVRALQGLFTPGDFPNPSAGLNLQDPQAARASDGK